MSSQQQSRIDLPGFTTPLDLDEGSFPHALDREYGYYWSPDVPGYDYMRAMNPALN